MGYMGTDTGMGAYSVQYSRMSSWYQCGKATLAPYEHLLIITLYLSTNQDSCYLSWFLHD